MHTQTILLSECVLELARKISIFNYRSLQSMIGSWVSFHFARGLCEIDGHYSACHKDVTDCLVSERARNNTGLQDPSAWWKNKTGTTLAFRILQPGGKIKQTGREVEENNLEF
jgi:hypothetical protein